MSAPPPLTTVLVQLLQPAALVASDGAIEWANPALQALFDEPGVPGSVPAWQAAGPPGSAPLWPTLVDESVAEADLVTRAGVRRFYLRLVGGVPAGDRVLLLEALAPQPGFRELRERTALLEAVFRGLSEGVLGVDGDERIRVMSQAAQELTGFSEAEVLGRRCHEVFGAPPDACPFGRLIRSGESSYQRELSMRGKDGRALHVAVKATLLRAGDGGVDGAVVVLRDLSELDRLRAQVPGGSARYGIVGQHPSIRRVVERVETVAASDASILVLGESGTGKELVARAIHALSPRHAGPFVKVNCAALADVLLESELFGHVRGAFTGAQADRPGRLEAARGGTLLLDEVGETSAALQIKLLRVLQEGHYQRVGELDNRPADVRVVAATYRDLRREVARGRFRDDLFYRLCVVPIELPPLRERAADIPLLVEHFLERLAASEQGAKRVLPSVYPILQRYPWPGNVGELEHALAHAYACSPGDAIGTESLPAALLDGEVRAAPSPPGAQEVAAVQEALEASGWNRGAAARRLGISRTTLWRRMRALGIRDPQRGEK